ncbi:hypothetical protein FB451DRAFT_450941 [Mycena latifolia]|nr:hypothetical protein FB451DRAFT_450941 [Mycena latifolia]
MVKYFEFGWFLRAYLVEAPDAAEAIVAAKGLEYVGEHLVIPGRQRSACNLLAVLAQLESTAAAVMAMKPCEHLVALFSIHDSDVYSVVDNTPYEAAEALITIAEWQDRADAAVAARVLDHVVEQLASQSARRRQLACKLLQKLARHKSTAEAVIDLKPLLNSLQ